MVRLYVGTKFTGRFEWPVAWPYCMLFLLILCIEFKGYLHTIKDGHYMLLRIIYCLFIDAIWKLWYQIHKIINCKKNLTLKYHEISFIFIRYNPQPVHDANCLVILHLFSFSLCETLFVFLYRIYDSVLEKSKTVLIDRHGKIIYFLFCQIINDVKWMNHRNKIEFNL